MSWPLVSRFPDEMSDAYIDDRIRHAPKVLTGLCSLPDDEAVDELRSAFEQLVVPTAQMRFVIRNMTSKARSYARFAYDDAPAFLSRMYSSGNLSRDIRLTILTGLAGTGKTAVLKSFLRLHESIVVGIPGHGSFNLHPAWILTAQNGVSTKELLLPHFRSNCKPAPSKLDSSKVIRECATQGIPLLLGDEFQFISRSNGAAMAANAILRLTKIGPPVFISTNYSLLHSFMRRPQEDRQRFFSDVLEILPERKESKDWAAIVHGALSVACEFSFLREESQIHLHLHELTFGINRLLMSLLRHSFSAMRDRSGAHVTIDDVHKAYASINYSASREEIRQLEAGVINPRSLPPDLHCPVYAKSCFSSISDGKQSVGDTESNVLQAELESSLNASEAAAAKDKSSSKPPARKRMAKPKYDAESLVDAAHRFGKNPG